MGLWVTTLRPAITRRGERTSAARRIPRTGDIPGNGRVGCVELVAAPEQPIEVLQAVAELLEPVRPVPDPWWQAGIAEALET
jgi:hypothetical protein